GLAVRQSTGSRLEVQRPEPRVGRVLGDAEPASGRGQYPLRRRLGPLHQELDQPHDLGRARLDQWRRSDRLGSVLRWTAGEDAWGASPRGIAQEGNGALLTLLAVPGNS